jgi:hypothetical protein
MPRIGRSIDDRWFRGRNVGRVVLWEKAFLRPARTHDGRGKFFESDPEDRGYIYAPAKKVHCILTSDSREGSFDVAAAWQQGSCYLTCSASVDLGEQDRITFLDLPIRTSLEITRGSGASDALTSHLGVVEVVGLVGEDDTFFRAGFDFQLAYNADKTISSIRWEGADAPSEGENYTALLNVRPRWLVPDPPRTRSFGTKQLPLGVKLLADDQRARK